MRRFTLYNSKGQSYDLSSSDHVLYSPAGLGFEFDRDYEAVGYQYELLKEELAQAKPSGMIKFDSYSTYTAFALFLQSRPLILEYEPYSDAVFRMSVNVGALSKGEKDETTGWLECAITFQALGQWYRYIVMQTDPSGLIGKKYTYKYNYSYTDSAVGSLKCTLQSNIESPCRITFLGPVKNPSWSHYKNGKLCAQGRVTANIPDNHRLVVSSVVPYIIQETDNVGNVIADRYGNSDFSTERFLYLGEGENVISFTHEGTGNLVVLVEAYEYFETV